MSTNSESYSAADGVDYRTLADRLDAIDGKINSAGHLPSLDDYVFYGGTLDINSAIFGEKTMDINTSVATGFHTPDWMHVNGSDQIVFDKAGLYIVSMLCQWLADPGGAATGYFDSLIGFGSSAGPGVRLWTQTLPMPVATQSITLTTPAFYAAAGDLAAVKTQRISGTGTYSNTGLGGVYVSRIFSI